MTGIKDNIPDLCETLIILAVEAKQAVRRIERFESRWGALGQALISAADACSWQPDYEDPANDLVFMRMPI